MFEQAGEGFAIAAKGHRLDQPIMLKRAFSLVAHYADALFRGCERRSLDMHGA